jgi:sensor domain CHASE-containing protein
MIDTDKDKAWLSTLVEKETKDEFAALAKELDTDVSKLLRQIVREKLEESRHVRKIAQRITPKVREIAK